MNYVQEELLRQERVLTVLLSGQRTARQEEAPPERAEADPGSTAIREPDAPTRAAARAGTQQAGVRVGASRADPAELDGTPEGSVAGVPPGRETVTRRTGGRAGRGAPAAAWSSGIPQPDSRPVIHSRQLSSHTWLLSPGSSGLISSSPWRVLARIDSMWRHMTASARWGLAVAMASTILRWNSRDW